MVRPACRKAIAQWAVTTKKTSICLACTTFSISQTCYYYKPLLSDENEEIADWLLRLTTCHKRVYRIYRELELNLRIKPRRRLVRENPNKLVVLQAPNDTWSMGFMTDKLSNGSKFRTFNVLGVFNREGLGIEVGVSLPTARGHKGT